MSALLPQVTPPERSELDPIEIASRDEVAAFLAKRPARFTGR